MKKSYLLFIILAVVLVAGIGIYALESRGDEPAAGARFTSSKTAPVDFSDSDVIARGVYIGELNVGGKTKADARAMLEDSYDMPENQAVEIYWDAKPINTTLSSFGISWGIEEALDVALSMSERGGILERYMVSKDLSEGTFHIEVSKSLDIEKVESFVSSRIADEFDQSPVNASIKYKDGEFVVTPQVNGRRTNQSATVAAIMGAFSNLGKDENTLIAMAKVETVEPEIKTADLSSIQNRLGSYTTRYRQEWQPRRSRDINVEVATAYINGKVLMPGESASTSEMMKERIEENGYSTGGQFVNGQLEDSIGGGVCQVSTTLYNALLRAEIQIDKRSNHSMSVTYVKPSEDAAIATGSKDLIFTNNLENPIYIYGYTDGYEVTFRIYGKEYRPENRKIKFVSVEDSRVVSEIVYKDDHDMYVGETKTVGTAHDEIKSHLDKIVYIDDVEVSRETLHNDYYAPSIATVYKGTMPKPTEPAQNDPVPQTTQSDPGDNGGGAEDGGGDDGAADSQE